MQSTGQRESWQRAQHSVTALVACGVLTIACARRTPSQARKQAASERPLLVAGNYTADTLCGTRPVVLTLKTGLRAEVCRTSATGTAQLAVATARSAAAELAPDFVPLGPRFSVSAPDAEIVCSYVAESYQIRRGFLAVLAVLGAGKITLVDARYADGRFAARVTPKSGARMQFGLVAATSRDAPGARNAAP